MTDWDAIQKRVQENWAKRWGQSPPDHVTKQKEKKDGKDQQSKKDYFQI